MISLKKNKWISGAIPGLLLHICAGTVYCWSLLKSDISAFIPGDISWAFSLTIFFLGISAAVMGPFVEKHMKKVSIIATILFSIGMIGSGFSCHFGSLVGIYLFYGVIMGIGTGLTYIVPIKALALWFKDRKGLATGLAITGFGLAKFIGAPVMQYFINQIGIASMFTLMGTIYLLIMLFASWLLEKPDGSVVVNKISNLKTWMQSIFKSFSQHGFWILWLVFYINITCGLAIISSEKELFMLSLVIPITLGAALSGMLNAAGRLVASGISDYLNGKRYLLWYAILGMSVISMFLGLITPTLLWITVFLINIGYGAGFSIQPSLLSDLYGNSGLSINHGMILSAWAFAGLTGNQIAEMTLGLGGGLRELIVVIGFLYLVAIGLIFLFIKTKNPHKLVEITN